MTNAPARHQGEFDHILVVAVNPRRTDIKPLLMHPEKAKVIQTKAGDWEAVSAEAAEQARIAAT